MAKHQFSHAELAWLNHYVAQMLVVSRKHAAAFDTNKVAHKMRFKFTGQPLWVNLNARERELLMSLIVYRESTLSNDLANEELQLVRGIRNELCV
jgi:hypothetical protein